MRKKIISAVSGIVLIGIGFFIASSLAGRETPERRQSEKVAQSVVAEAVLNHTIPTTVTESGILIAKNRIELFSEVQGVMETATKEFKPGTSYKRGALMIKIRDDDYSANLRAQKSNLKNLITSALPDLRLDFPEVYLKWDQYVRNLDLNKPVPPLPDPTSEKEEFYITGKNIYTTYYNTKNMELVYNKYNLHAPFNGILTEALVNPGSLVRPGQKLGDFIDPSVYEMEVSVGKSFYPYISVGQKVKVQEGRSSSRQWDGKIIRINGKVDQGTQTVKAFIELEGNDLKEGMFLEAKIQGKEELNAFEVNRNLLINNSELFVVNDSSKLESKAIDPIYFTESTVIVRGLDNGDQLVTRPVAGGYHGMQVQVINQSTDE
jgi:multidrug efflux pump subunit AcrA (membrane-fusion protein)